MTSDTDTSQPGGPDPADQVDDAARPATRGRPRDEERTAAILEATHEVLHREGWHDLKVADIAKAAGCGLATIYRRWSTKEELVAAAFKQQPLPEIVETGDPATDFRSLVVALAEQMQTMGRNMISMLAATQSEPILLEAFEDSILNEARPRMVAYLAAVLGEDDPHVELVLDGVTGALFMRSSVLGLPVDPETFGDEAMALVGRLART